MKPTTLNETDEKKQGSDHDEPETKKKKVLEKRLLCTLRNAHVSSGISWIFSRFAHFVSRFFKEMYRIRDLFQT